MFPDPRLVAAIADRVTFNAHILETGTQSYRLATSKTSSRKRASQLQSEGLTSTIDPLKAGHCGLRSGRSWPLRPGASTTEALAGLILRQ